MIVMIIICVSPVDVEQPSLLDQRDQDDWPHRSMRKKLAMFCTSGEQYEAGQLEEGN